MTYPWNDHLDHDAFGELDLSGGGGKSGAVACMARRMVDLRSQEERLVQELSQVRTAQIITMAALDQFLAT